MKKQFFNLFATLLIAFVTVMGATSVVAQNGNVVAFRYEPTEANRCSTTLLFTGSGDTRTFSSIFIEHPLTNAKPNAILTLTNLIFASIPSGSKVVTPTFSQSFIYLKNESDLEPLFEAYEGQDISVISNNCPTKRWILFDFSSQYDGKKLHLTVANP